MLKKILLSTLSITSVALVQAQDIHFSQYFLSPVATAPSNTGNHNGDWRVFGNYRSQWNSIVGKPYVTPAIGGDYNFYVNKVDKASAGLYIVNDKSGGNLNVMKIMGSGAYHYALDKNYLHAGLQVGYVSKTIDKDSESYPNQFNETSGLFDNKSALNKEASLENKLSFIDVNLGLGWNRTFGKITPYANYSAFHVNAPNESFTGGTNKLKMRNMLNLGATIGINNMLTLHPSLLLGTQGKANELVGGANLHYNLDKKMLSKKYVYIGQYVRYGVGNIVDATFTTVGMSYKAVQVGISYDVNISQLKTVTANKGAYELAFIYTGLSSRLTKKEIPCDRY
jgi:type IX secretion system PorP/SprF family membrane protein